VRLHSRMIASGLFAEHHCVTISWITLRNQEVNNQSPARIIHNGGVLCNMLHSLFVEVGDPNPFKLGRLHEPTNTSSDPSTPLV
jgi:hypothetical protein